MQPDHDGTGPVEIGTESWILLQIPLDHMHCMYIYINISGKHVPKLSQECIKLTNVNSF